MRTAAVFLLLFALQSAGTIRTPGILCAESLSFEQVRKLAEDRSEILMLQRSALRQAGLSLAETRSRLGPELSFQASGSYLANPPEGITVRAGELGTIPNPLPPPALIAVPAEDLTFIEDSRHGYFEFTLELRQPLYTWGKLENAVDLAALGLDASRAEFSERVQELNRDLHGAYFSGVLARESAGLLQQILDILLEIEQDRQRAFQLGSVNKLAVLQIQTQLSAVRRQLVQAQEAYRTALQALALYTGLDPLSLSLDSGFRTELPDIAEAELKEQAAENAPTLKKVLLEREQARVNLKLVRGGAILRPDFSFKLSFEVSGQAIPWSEAGWQDTWKLNLIAGVGMDGSLFDSGRSGQQLRQAEEVMAASQQTIELTRKQLHLQVRQAVEALRQRWAELQETRTALSQAAEEEKNAREGFDQQILTREHWGAARIALLQKRLDVLRYAYSFERALHELESLAGFY
ncbi:MAG: TolC family protein [Spirochaetaceae bacterium]|nr:MAG: TolC family protein [Spirochaetaceae bacterium]